MAKRKRKNGDVDQAKKKEKKEDELDQFIKFIKQICTDEEHQKLLLDKLNDEKFDSLVDDAMNEKFDETVEWSTLFQYKVPKLDPNGACSKKKELEKDPFDIAKSVYKIDFKEKTKQNEEIATRQYRLGQVVKKIHGIVGMDWFGIYKLIDWNK